jgi:hypothetical protein
MKPIQKSRVKTGSKALIDDLSAVRAAVLDKRPATEQSARFEARLFESWVIDRLAQHECQLAMITEELASLREDLEALLKDQRRPARKIQMPKGKG